MWKRLVKWWKGLNECDHIYFPRYENGKLAGNMCPLCGKENSLEEHLQSFEGK